MREVAIKSYLTWGIYEAGTSVYNALFAAFDNNFDKAYCLKSCSWPEPQPSTDQWEVMEIDGESDDSSAASQGERPLLG